MALLQMGTAKPRMESGKESPWQTLLRLPQDCFALSKQWDIQVLLCVVGLL